MSLVRRESLASQSKIREFLRDGPKSNAALLEHLDIKLGTLQWHIQKMELAGDVTLDRTRGRSGKPHVMTYLTDRGRAKLPYVEVERSPLKSGNVPWWCYVRVGGNHVQA